MSQFGLLLGISVRLELDSKKFAQLFDKIEAEADQFLLARSQVFEIHLAASTWKLFTIVSANSHIVRSN